jgi:hypothetical protein
MTFDREVIHPYGTEDLIRFGQNKDGGYVLNRCVVSPTSILVSLGINADWSFEEDFSRHSDPGLQIYGFDFSVSGDIFHKEYISRVLYLFSIKFLLRLARNPSGAANLWKEIAGYARDARRHDRAFPLFFDGGRRKFFQLGVSNFRDRRFITFPDLMEKLPEGLPDHSLFLKIDIEQSEFRIMDDVIACSRVLSGLAIEFHDLDILWEPFSRFMHAFQRDFVLTHVHGNNYSGLIPGTDIPKALEVTLVHKVLLPADLKPFNSWAVMARV